MNPQTLTVDMVEGPGEDEKFTVYAKGSIMRLTVEQIKWHAMRGNKVILRVVSVER